MKKPFVCFLFFIFGFSFNHLSFSGGGSISAQSWDWGREANGSVKSNDCGSPVAIDESGNAYITGQYALSVNFGRFTLTDDGNDIVYLAKYDPSGNAIWAVQPVIDSGFSTASFGTSVTVDDLGDIEITGFFYGTLVFGNDTLQADSNFSVFLVKYNSSGNVLWAKQAIVPNKSNNAFDQSFSVTGDQSSNILITGTFQDSITFGAYTLSDPDSISSAVFLVKYDPSGNVVWAKQSASAFGSSGTGNSVIVDNQNNIYITGNFQDSITFGSYILASYTPQVFITKYSATGNVLWSKQSESSIGEAFANSIVVDGKENPYIAGYFIDSAKFGPYPIYAPDTLFQAFSAFLAKYDVNGNVIWVKQSTLGMEATSMSADGADHIYMAGILNNNNNYYFGNYTLRDVPKADTLNAFLLKFDSAGTAVCGSVVENLFYNNQLIGIAAKYANASNSYIYMAGTFENGPPVLCGPDTLYALMATIFLGRWLECPADAGVNQSAQADEQLKIYPNPSNGFFQLEIRNYELGINNTIEVYNILGEKVYSKFLIPNSQFLIDLNSQPNGIYLYRVISETGNLVGEGKLVVQK